MDLSEAEWKVMNALWDRAPATAREVHGAVTPDTGWAYSTVKTLLTRLVEKGAVSVEQRSSLGIFSPKVDRREARRSAVRGLLGRAFGGTFSALLHHIVDDERLSLRDRETLSRLLEASRKTRSKARRRR